MNKIRVIDLLNKIANGEEVPKKIKYYEIEFIFDGKCYRTEHEDYHTSDVKEYLYLLEYIASDDLFEINREVEIIEEDKKIGKLVSSDIYVSDDKLFIPNRDKKSDNNIYLIQQKINELIDEVNKLKEENNE